MRAARRGDGMVTHRRRRRRHCKGGGGNLFPDVLNSSWVRDVRAVAPIAVGRSTKRANCASDCGRSMRRPQCYAVAPHISTCGSSSSFLCVRASVRGGQRPPPIGRSTTPIRAPPIPWIFIVQRPSRARAPRFLAAANNT